MTWEDYLTRLRFHSIAIDLSDSRQAIFSATVNGKREHTVEWVLRPNEIVDERDIKRICKIFGIPRDQF